MLKEIQRAIDLTAKWQRLSHNNVSLTEAFTVDHQGRRLELLLAAHSGHSEHTV